MLVKGKPDAVPAVAEVIDEAVKRRFDVALLQVQGYAPDAPEVIQKEAVIRLVGYMRQVLTALQFSKIEIGSIKPHFRMPRDMNMLRSSGVMAMLAPYRSHDASVIRQGML